MEYVQVWKTDNVNYLRTHRKMHVQVHAQTISIVQSFNSYHMQISTLGTPL